MNTNITRKSRLNARATLFYSEKTARKKIEDVQTRLGYMMAAELPEGKGATDGLAVLHVPSQTYAVFDSRESIPDDVEIGLEILNVWRRIYSEWFPSASFEQVEGPCVEKYFWTDESEQEYICEVWIPVRRKA